MSNKLAQRVHFVSTPPAGEDFLQQLRRVNGERWKAWTQSDEPDPLYMSNEFGGEAGEVQNVVKKLVRESRGWKGSRASVAQLGDEIADCIICLDSLARAYGLHLAEIISAKFNATSVANGFEHRLGVAQAPSRKCGTCDDSGYKDHAGFAMDLCDHQTAPAADEVEAELGPLVLAGIDKSSPAELKADVARLIRRVNQLEAALRARSAEPVQDRHELPAEPQGEAPVAWIYECEDLDLRFVEYERESVRASWARNMRDWAETPVYARPATPGNPERLVDAPEGFQPDDNGFSDAECIAIGLESHAREKDRAGLPASAGMYRRGAELLRIAEKAFSAAPVENGEGVAAKARSDAEAILGRLRAGGYRASIANVEKLAKHVLKLTAPVAAPAEEASR